VEECAGRARYEGDRRGRPRDESKSRKKKEVKRRGRAGDKPLFGRKRAEESVKNNEAGVNTLLRML